MIGDDVEIGANTTIDRGALDDTVIEEGVKLDNQIQIGHNCRIGAHTAIAGCVGIAGSSTIGRALHASAARAMIGGHLDDRPTASRSPAAPLITQVDHASPAPTPACIPVRRRTPTGCATPRYCATCDELAERVRALEKTLADSERNRP